MNVTLTRWVTCSWSAQERMPPVTPCPEFQGHKVDDGCPTLVGGQMGAAASVTPGAHWEHTWNTLGTHLEHTGSTPGAHWEHTGSTLGAHQEHTGNVGLDPSSAAPLQRHAAQDQHQLWSPSPILGPGISPCLLHFLSLLPVSVVSAQLVVQTHGVPPVTRVSLHMCVDHAAVSCLGSAGGRAPGPTFRELSEEMSRRTWS